MKRESVNTFSGGLTYDINPITTPNNVLTDGVNATFLTFNGDEMALQNDAGNTKIIASYGDLNKEPYDEDKVYYKNALVVHDGKLYYCKEDGVTGEFNILNWKEVTDSIKLSDGFKPIGLKEHGGILYIVSHRKDGESDEFEIGSYPSPGYRKADITTDTTAVKVVEKVEPVDPVEEFDVVHRLGEFIQLSNSEVFPGDPYRIKFSTIDNLTVGNIRKFYTFEFYLKPKEGDFISLKDIGIVDSLTPFYSNEVGNGVSFVPNNGSGKLFIKFELEDIDEFTQYSKIDRTTYYFPRLEFVEEDTFIEFDHFNVKNESKIKLDAIEMEYTLTNSQTGDTTEVIQLELKNISEKEGEFECKVGDKNYFRVKTPDTNRILDYTFTPKNNHYNILFNNHIIKNSIDLSIDPLLWGNYLTYSEVEKGNFYFQSPDSKDLLIFKNGNPIRDRFKINYLNWLTRETGYLNSDRFRLELDNCKGFLYAFNNVLQNRSSYSNTEQKINYTIPFNYKDFTKSSYAHRDLYVGFDYRCAAFEYNSINKYELRNEDGDWLKPTWWDTTIGGGFDTETHGADRAIFLDDENNVVAVGSRTLPGGWNPVASYRYGYFLSRKPTREGDKYLKINGETVKTERDLSSPGKFSYSMNATGGDDYLIDSIELIHYSSTGVTTPESYVGSFGINELYVSVYNKGKDITLMKKATANFEGIVKPTTYDFKEAVLNDSDNLITPPSGLLERQSNIVFEGKAQRRYLLDNTNIIPIPTLIAGNTYTLAFYIIAEGISTINITILGNSYTINYALDEGILKSTVVGSPYKQTHNHEVVDGLYVHNIPILHNYKYYSYVKYTFTYTNPGNLILSISENTFEIAELTLKKGTIIPQAVQAYQDILHGKMDDIFKTNLYNLSEDEIDNNVLGKLYIPNTNYEIRGVLTNEL